MDYIAVPLLTVAVFYVGLAIQTYLDLLMDQRVRQGNSGLGLLMLLGRAFLWPLVLLDIIRINGLMTRVEALEYNGELSWRPGW